VYEYVAAFRHLDTIRKATNEMDVVQPLGS
jgi:hypothetical protein